MATHSVSESPARPKPYGIGGWLILPIIGFVGTIALTLINLLGADSIAGFKMVFLGDTPLGVSMRVPVGLSLLGGILVLASAAYSLFLTFAKKRLIVAVATLHYLILAAAGLIDLWGEYRIVELVPGQSVDAATYKQALRGVIAALIWIPYFRVSKRVRNTCVEP